MSTLVIALLLPVLVACCSLTWANLKQWKASATLGRAKILRDLGVDPRNKRIVVGFFHPYCNAGGGGERVLWTAVAHLQRTEPDVVSVVYTGDVDASKEHIIAKVKERFNITLQPNTLSFVYVKSRYLIEETTWPRFTLLGQSLGSVSVGFEALGKVLPDIYIDTMGYAFTYPLLALLHSCSIPIGAYVHYPTISTDMLERVRQRKVGHTNQGNVAASPWQSSIKLAYYRMFAVLYAFSLRQADEIVVNSSWTKNHVDTFIAPRKSMIVYPPCSLEDLQNFPLEKRQRVIISIAQFRPEKEYPVQIKALYHFLQANPQCRKGPQMVRLVMIGSSRNKFDEARVEGLRTLAETLGVTDNIELVVNAPFDTLTYWLSRASIGINTMIDEHFGINVVEYMASGLIPLVHASGGPLHDIVTPTPSTRAPTGFHSTTPESFAKSMETIFNMSEKEQVQMRQRARISAERFGREEFEKSWVVMWKNLKANARPQS